MEEFVFFKEKNGKMCNTIHNVINFDSKIQEVLTILVIVNLTVPVIVNTPQHKVPVSVTYKLNNI